jgi:hypothetical protein
MNSYILKIFLYETEPQVWRRFSIPETATFSELHQMIQKAMGWHDEQAHQFRYGKGRHLKQVIADSRKEVGPADEYTDEKDITLAQFAGRRKLPLRMMYRYDFFDEWTHEIVIEEKSEDIEAPKLLGGERACPPEDCGGPFGYKECLAGYAEWMDDDYDPEVFDAGSVQLG